MEDAKLKMPLAGIRVLDLSRIIAAPYAGQMLADMGAEVIKVERPDGVGDPLRHTGPPFLRDRNGADLPESAYSLASNRNKLGVTAELARPEGQALVRALAAKCDVLIENYKVGDLARYGLDYRSIAKDNPNIIYCSVTGYGQDGPYSDQPAFDTQFQALSGIMSLTGEPDGLPQRVGVTFGDISGGMYAAFAIVTALADRLRGGPGRHIDLSLLDVSFAMTHHRTQQYLISGKVPERLGSAVSETPISQALRCKDGLLMIQASDDKRFHLLCKALDASHLAADPRYATRAARQKCKAELVTEIERRLAGRTVAEWCAFFLTRDVMACPIQDVAQAVNDAQLRHRCMVVEVPHAEAGTISLIGVPVKMSKTPPPHYAPPPRTGEHTDKVLTELLGYDAARIESLRAAGIV